MFGRWQKSKQETPVIDWQGLVDSIYPHKESHSIFAVSEGDVWILIEAPATDIPADTLGLTVAYDVEGVEAWDTEVPAKYMAEKLSNILDIELSYALSRSPDHYAGFYVDIYARYVTNSAFHKQHGTSDGTNN